MSAELEVDFGVTGQTVYFLLRNSTGSIYNGASFAAYNNTNYATYPITGTEQTGSGFYTGTMPSVSAGTYNVVAKQQVGGSPAQTDPTIGVGNIQWDGTLVPGYPPNLADLAITSAGLVAIQSGFTQDVAYNDFTFVMVSNTDHVTPLTGLTVTATRSINAGAFGACTNAVSEVGDGVYSINFAASDLNGNTITFQATASGADTRLITLLTTPA